MWEKILGGEFVSKVITYAATAILGFGASKGFDAFSMGAARNLQITPLRVTRTTVCIADRGAVAVALKQLYVTAPPTDVPLHSLTEEQRTLISYREYLNTLNGSMTGSSSEVARDKVPSTLEKRLTEARVLSCPEKASAENTTVDVTAVITLATPSNYVLQRDCWFSANQQQISVRLYESGAKAEGLDDETYLVSKSSQQVVLRFNHEQREKNSAESTAAFLKNLDAATYKVVIKCKELTRSADVGGKEFDFNNGTLQVAR